jgi:hypothetical protein
MPAPIYLQNYRNPFLPLLGQMFLMKMGANIREKEATIASTRADTRQKESDVRRAQIEGKIQEQLPPGDMPSKIHGVPEPGTFKVDGKTYKNIPMSAKVPKGGTITLGKSVFALKYDNQGGVTVGDRLGDAPPKGGKRLEVREDGTVVWQEGQLPAMGKTTRGFLEKEEFKTNLKLLPVLDVCRQL